MTSSDRPALPKGTFFCPTCGHQSHYDGDWRVVTRRGTRTLKCPDCHTAVSSRGPACSPWSPATVWDRWNENLLTWQTFWWRRLTP